MSIITRILLGVLVVLFAASLIRLVRTSAVDAVRGERWDTSALLLLVLLGIGGSIARDRADQNSLQYREANGILIAISLMALFFVYRLFRAYRSGPIQHLSSNTLVITPPKTDQQDSKQDQK